MHGKHPKVSCLFGPPVQKSYRLAVRAALCEVKTREGLSFVELSERLGCCEQTVTNAMDEYGTGCLSPVIMLRIGYEFGDAVLEPVFALSRKTSVDPVTREDRFARIERELAALRRDGGE